MLGPLWGFQGVGVSGVYWGLAGTVGTQGPEGYRGHKGTLRVPRGVGGHFGVSGV